MKRWFCVITVVITLVLLSCSVVATEPEIPVLSNMSDEECVAFIKGNGVSIPFFL